MIKNIDVKINFSDKNKTILSINHNYYVRTAIATLADMFLTLFIMSLIAAAFTGVLVLAGIIINNSASRGNYLGNYLIFFAVVLDIILALSYFIYVIVKIARVSKMRKQVNRIENQIIAASTVGEDATKAAED